MRPGLGVATTEIRSRTTEETITLSFDKGFERLPNFSDIDDVEAEINRMRER